MRRLALWLAALPAAAMAHEGDPRPWGVHFPAADGHRAWVVDEMGVLVERDDGFRWLCDNAISQTEGLRHALPTGPDRWLVTTRGHVRWSADRGCTFAAPAGAPFAEHRVGPVSGHPTAPAEVVLGTNTLGRTNDLYRSQDGGQRWTPAGLGLTAGVQQIVRAPGAPHRLYVRTLDQLLRSDDGGERVVALSPRFAEFEAQFDAFRLLTVSADDPDVLFGALDHFPDGLLVRSDDGGASWRRLATITDDVVEALVEAPDGALLFSAPFTGLFRSRDAGRTWAAVESPGILGCLTRDPRSQALWGCLRGTPLPWVVASSTDFGDTWTPQLAAYADIAGHLTCPAGTPTHRVCSQECDPADRACADQPRADAGVDATTEAAAQPSGGCQSGPGPASGWLGLLAALGLLRRQGEAVSGSKRHSAS